MLKKALAYALALFAVLLVISDGLHRAKQIQKTAGAPAPAVSSEPPSFQQKESGGEELFPAETPEPVPEPTPVRRQFLAADAAGISMGTRFLEKFADGVFAGTNGLIRISVPGAYSGKTAAWLLRAMKEGDLDILVLKAEDVLRTVPEAEAIVLDGVLAGYGSDAVFSVLNGNNAYTQLLAERAAEHGFRIAAAIPPEETVIVSDRPLIKPEDFRDLRILTESAGAESFYRALGAVPETKTGDALNAALDYPIANAWETTSEGIAKRQAPEAMDFMTKTGRTEGILFVLVREKLFRLMTEEQQICFADACFTAARNSGTENGYPEGCSAFDTAFYEQLRNLPQNKRTYEAFEKTCPGVLQLLNAELEKAQSPIRSTVSPTGMPEPS